MWSSVLLLGFLTGINPLRIGLALLVLSRPRPMQNLLVYGAGSLTACIVAVSTPLTVMHVTGAFEPIANNFATGIVARYVQFASGVVLLSIAAMLLVRQRQQSAAVGGGPSASNFSIPPAITRRISFLQEEAPERESVFRRVVRRGHREWTSGALWVSFALGFTCGGVEPDAGLFLLAFIVTSGVSLGEQILASIAFIVGLLVVIEATLIAYLVAPRKTEAALQRTHDWVVTHSRVVLIVMCFLGGLALIGRGMTVG